jgi:hypothetical protein
VRVVLLTFKEMFERVRANNVAFLSAERRILEVEVQLRGG